MRSSFWVPVLLFASLPPASSAQTHMNELINLGTLKGTVVDASSVNGGRTLYNRFYGVRNLFDGGENLINGINYTYWLTDSASRHWIKLRFEAPVEVHLIMLEFNATAPVRGEMPRHLAQADEHAVRQTASRRPEGFAIDVSRETGGTQATQKLPSAETSGFRTFYPLEEALQDVTELLLVFPGPSMIEVAEVEVLGKSSIPVVGAGEGPALEAAGTVR